MVVAQRAELPHAILRPPHPDHSGIATVTPAYSCEDANKIRLDESAYEPLSSIAKVLIDAQSKKCALAEERKAATPEHPVSDSTVVVFANPVATNDNDKVFYGLVEFPRLMAAEKICGSHKTPAGRVDLVAGVQGYGVVAFDIVNAVTTDAGLFANAVFNFESVRCRGLQHAAADESDVIVFIGPNAIVAQAKTRNLTDNVLQDVPSISSAKRDAIAALVADGRGAGPTPTLSVVASWSGTEVMAPAGKVFVAFPHVKISSPNE